MGSEQLAWAMYSGQCIVCSGQWVVGCNSGLWAVDSKQWAVYTVGRVKRAASSGQCTVAESNGL